MTRCTFLWRTNMCEADELWFTLQCKYRVLFRAFFSFFRPVFLSIVYFYILCSHIAYSSTTHKTIINAPARFEPVILASDLPRSSEDVQRRNTHLIIYDQVLQDLHEQGTAQNFFFNDINVTGKILGLISPFRRSQKSCSDYSYIILVIYLFSFWLILPLTVLHDWHFNFLEGEA